MGDVPRSERFDDVYFSAHDGMAETRHVFIDGNNLPERWQGRPRFTIAETGFGTGLNFLSAWDLFDRTADKGAFLDFISVEKYPLEASEIRKGLSPFAARLSPYLEKMLLQYPMRVPGFHRMVFDNRVALTLIFDDANDALPEVEGAVDAWFLDGFTPSKNPDMWTPQVFSHMARLSAANATFATFTAAGFVKRGLHAAGFAVEKRKGFGPKRDMLAGFYEGDAAPAPSHPPRTIAIHGAGLAGTACAHVFAQYGLSAELYDPSGLASGASGNKAGLVNPRLSAFRTAESDFNTAAFALARRTFAHLPETGYHPCGGLHLVTDADKEKRFSRTAENWGWHTDHLKMLTPAAADAVSGINLGRPALYLPDAARIDPHALCRAYAANTPVRTDSPPAADVVVHATGAGAQTLGLPVETVRGQITFVRATRESLPLKTNVSYGGYISAPLGGVHAVGATFQKWLTDTKERPEDDADNLETLRNAIPFLDGFEIAGHRAALRTASRDRFPIVGPHGGGYVTTAHGSHGILSTLASAHLLADFLRGGPFSLGKSAVNALSPARFSLKAAKNPRLPSA